jgi:hypothetical protein
MYEPLHSLNMLFQRKVDEGAFLRACNVREEKNMKCMGISQAHAHGIYSHVCKET